MQISSYSWNGHKYKLAIKKDVQDSFTSISKCKCKQELYHLHASTSMYSTVSMQMQIDIVVSMKVLGYDNYFFVKKLKVLKHFS